MPTFKQWLNTKHNGSYHAKELTDLKLDWLEETVLELSQRLVALENPAPIAPVEQVATVWPKSPLICHCETFEGEGWECERCGGGRF